MALNRIAALVLLVALLLAGCGSDDEGSADCGSQVRLDGVVYTSHGFTERGGERIGPVEVAECQDVGEDARGAVFPDDPRKVEAVRIPGHDTDEVLGVRFDDDSFTVYVAESVPDDEQERIYEELSNAG